MKKPPMAYHFHSLYAMICKSLTQVSRSVWRCLTLQIMTIVSSPMKNLFQVIFQCHHFMDKEDALASVSSVC